MKADAKSLVALFAEDGMEFSPPSGHSIQGRDSLTSFWVGAFRTSHPMRATVTTVDVVLNGGYATEVGNYAHTYPPDSTGHAPQNISGGHAVVWKRQGDGSWKIYIDMEIPK
ncbi:MAG: nuclear transport factor 2 family protein [Candidatus Eisenbacteria bacterium]|nr:nuclear transport factor 2 family protein [Candidatus Eisenbacteria bacterium]